MEYVAAAPSSLSKQRRKAFLKEASKRFQAQMVKQTASQSWGHSEEAVKRFVEAMQEARAQAPKEERWKLNKSHSHKEMAQAALVMYEVMQGLLPKFERHPKRDNESYRKVHGDVGNTSVGAIIEGGANGVLISEQTAKRKGLLDKVDKTKKVTLSQAEREKKMRIAWKHTAL